MRKCWLVLFVLIFETIILWGNVNPDDRKVLFRNISINDGLSQNTVFSITQDTLGYMWFATQDGLNRYDGYEFKVFRPDDEDEGSIASNYIRKVFVDKEGTLWIGGDGGISRYDFVNDRFINYKVFEYDFDRFIYDIEADSTGRLWAISSTGDIFIFKEEKDSFQRIDVFRGDEEPRQCHELLASNNTVLIGSDRGLFRMDMERMSAVKLPLWDEDVSIRSIINDPNGGIWIATEGHGVMLLGQDFQIKKTLRHQVNNDNSLSNNNVRSLLYSEDGKLWIGSFVGLNIYNPGSGHFSRYLEDFSRPNALSQNSVRCIFKDRQGGMWLGTFFGGINYYHPASIKFDLINQNGSELSLSDNVVSPIVEDLNGNVWIGTNDKGLNKWDRKRNKIAVFEFDERDRNSLSSNNIKAILPVGGNKLLVGTHNSGLNYFDPVTKQNRIFKHNESVESIGHNSIYSLLQDQKSRIWVGTWRGLDRFDISTGKFQHYKKDSRGNELSSDRISHLFEDSRGRIWIGTNNGLNIFYPEKELFESFKHRENVPGSISNNSINCIAEDEKGRIWIGTRSGLNVFDEIERTFKRYTTKDGLPNNVIFGILEDEKGCLWISTSNGLACFDTATKKINNFGLSDGLQSLQFNNYAFEKLADGTFLFGGINGVSVFKPEEIAQTPFNPEVILTQLRVFYQRVLPGDHNEILDKPISQTAEICLKSDQNVFAFNFAAINYIASKKVQYLIKLENYDNEWRLGSPTRSATFSNLPYGKYTFMVKAVSGEGLVSDQVTSIDVHILKPWYLMYWALGICILLFITLTYLGFKLAKERIRTQNDLRIERLEKQKLTEINKMKLEFFTNISHEFKTPLTLILSPLEKIREKRILDEWLVKQHELIYRNTKRLMGLIDQLMDFRKSEQGKLKLKASKGDFIAAINEIYLSFASVASHNNIIYTFDSKEDKLEFYFDINIIEKVVFNLLSNAFKFTPSGATIGIQIQKSGDNVILEISDSGKGIDSDKLSLIFERFYQIDENVANPGSGIGLALTKRLVGIHHGTIDVESEKGKGSKFIISLPLNETIFNPGEIHQEQASDSDYKHDFVKVDYDNVLQEKLNSLEIEGKDTVLIVEDNVDIINYLKDNLSENYSVSSAPNGEEALKMVSESQPDLIISDVMMPVMDGIKFCKSIKQNIKTCHIPIILLTAKSQIDEQVEGIKSGADDYVPKPFSMNLLDAKVGNIIKTRKRLKTYYSDTMDIEPEKLAFSTLDEELLQKAKDIVNEHLSETEFSVDIFAREMGMSRSNLHLKLKAVTGESATDFIKKVRFGKAINLLEQKRHSVAEVSYMVGFNSPSYFSTSFKKYFGYLPTEHESK